MSAVMMRLGCLRWNKCKGKFCWWTDRARSFPSLMLADLDQLVQNIVDLTVLPLKIRGCDGSPMRVVAIKE